MIIVSTLYSKMERRQRPQACRCQEEDGVGIEFKKILESEEAGIVIYRDAGNGESYIIKNTKKQQATSEDFTIALEQNKIICPWCVKILEHAESLVKCTPLIESQDVVSICDHCHRRGGRKRPRSSGRCRQIINTVLKGMKLEEVESRKQSIKQWLLEARQLLQNDSNRTDKIVTGLVRNKAIDKDVSQVDHVPFKKVEPTDSPPTGLKIRQPPIPEIIHTDLHGLMRRVSSYDNAVPKVNPVDDIKFKQLEPTDGSSTRLKTKPPFPESVHTDLRGLMRRDPSLDNSLQDHFENNLLNSFHKNKTTREPKLTKWSEEKQLRKKESPFKVGSFLDFPEKNINPNMFMISKSQGGKIKETQKRPSLKREKNLAIGRESGGLPATPNRHVPKSSLKPVSEHDLTKVFSFIFPQDIITTSSSFRFPSSTELLKNMQDVFKAQAEKEKLAKDDEFKRKRERESEKNNYFDGAQIIAEENDKKSHTLSKDTDSSSGIGKEKKVERTSIDKEASRNENAYTAAEANENKDNKKNKKKEQARKEMEQKGWEKREQSKIGQEKKIIKEEQARKDKEEKGREKREQSKNSQEKKIIKEEQARKDKEEKGREKGEQSKNSQEKNKIKEEQARKDKEEKGLEKRERSKNSQEKKIIKEEQARKDKEEKGREKREQSKTSQEKKIIKEEQARKDKEEKGREKREQSKTSQEKKIIKEEQARKDKEEKGRVKREQSKTSQEKKIKKEEQARKDKEEKGREKREQSKTSQEKKIIKEEQARKDKEEKGREKREQSKTSQEKKIIKEEQARKDKEEKGREKREQSKTSQEKKIIKEEQARKDKEEKGRVKREQSKTSQEKKIKKEEQAHKDKEEKNKLKKEKQEDRIAKEEKTRKRQDQIQKNKDKFSDVKDETLKGIISKDAVSKGSTLKDATPKREKPGVKVKEDKVKDVTGKEDSKDKIKSTDIKYTLVTSQPFLKDKEKEKDNPGTKVFKVVIPERSKPLMVVQKPQRTIKQEKIKLTKSREVLILKLIKLKQKQYGLREKHRPTKRYAKNEPNDVQIVSMDAYALYNESDLMLELAELEISKHAASSKRNDDGENIIIGNTLKSRTI